MITEKAMEMIRDYIQTTFLFYNVGRGGDTTGINATSLDAPINATNFNNSTGSITTDKTGLTSLDFTITLNGSDYVGEIIREVGIFDSATLASANMLIRVPFNAIGPLTASDTIELVVTVDVI
jgi:hypothetical protein